MERTNDGAGRAAGERFVWHPTYQGRTWEEVTVTLRGDLAHDQRAYALLLEGAEDREDAALAGVLELEKRWGPFDFGWAETDPESLAGRITAFEWERERRRELVPYEEYRRASAPPSELAGGDASRERPWWAFWRD